MTTPPHPIHVTLIDDRPDQLERLARPLRGLQQIELTTVTDGHLRELLHQLWLRRRKERDEGPMLDAVSEPTILDTTDICIVDNDLAHLKDAGIATGEDIAYLARAYTRCGPTVVINRYQRNFDLTMYDEHGEADHYLSGDYLSDPVLWGETVAHGERFQPWNWPNLLDAVNRFQSATRDVHNYSEDTTVAEILGLDADTRSRLPREVEARIGGHISDVTLKNVLENSLEPKDRQSDPEIRARIIAAQILKWVARAVLPLQDIFVDAPHLVPRIPSIVGDHVRDLDHWNALCHKPRFLGPDHVVSFLRPALYEKDHWCPHTVWLASKVETLGIEDLRNPFSMVEVPFVFCEDFSCFFLREQSHAIVTDIPGRFSLRWVRDADGNGYQPMSRLYL